MGGSINACMESVGLGTPRKAKNHCYIPSPLLQGSPTTFITKPLPTVTPSSPVTAKEAVHCTCLRRLVRIVVLELSG